MTTATKLVPSSDPSQRSNSNSNPSISFKFAPPPPFLDLNFAYESFTLLAGKGGDFWSNSSLKDKASFLLPLESQIRKKFVLLVF